MLTSTLGGLIKDYRIKKRLSQVEVSLRIGWKDTSRLSKIEQGRTSKPTRTTAEKIMTALDLNDQERGNFLHAGGYLPTDDEIKKNITEFSHKIDTWEYPAYLMDFTFRWLYSNLHTLRALNIPVNQKNWVTKTKPNFLEFPFLPTDQRFVEIFKGENEHTLKEFSIAQIATFKTENEQYQNEVWYKKLIQYLMKYENFRISWPNVDLSMYHKKLFDYEYKRMIGIHFGENVPLNFHLFTAKSLSDPRFQVVLYTPADIITENIYKKYNNVNRA